jgi:hypothetical protein
MFDIADIPFSAVTDSEKQIYASTRRQNGMLQGYTSVQYTVRSSRAPRNTGTFDLLISIESNRITMVEYETNLNNTAVSGARSFL